jgi:hypothetical protein
LHGKSHRPATSQTNFITLRCVEYTMPRALKSISQRFRHCIAKCKSIQSYHHDHNELYLSWTQNSLPWTISDTFTKMRETWQRCF